jgi:predicted nucleic acid-binding protein
LCRRAARTSGADTELAFSSLLDLELIEACYQVALRERWGKQWKQRRPDGRARSRAARLADSATSAWTEIVQIVNATRVEATVVSAAVPDLMRTCALGSYDAVHVATANHLGIETVLTLDTGFARVPPSRLTIHTAVTKLPRMRSLRSS